MKHELIENERREISSSKGIEVAVNDLHLPSPPPPPSPSP